MIEMIIIVYFIYFQLFPGMHKMIEMEFRNFILTNRSEASCLTDK